MPFSALLRTAAAAALLLTIGFGAGLAPEQVQLASFVQLWATPLFWQFTGSAVLGVLTLDLAFGPMVDRVWQFLARGAAPAHANGPRRRTFF